MSIVKKYIVYQDDDLVALNKPSGLLSVPDRFDEQLPSLKKMLKDELGEIFVIHRLDRDTSGLILFARNADAHRYYSGIFEERKVEKTYLGLVHGVLPQGEGTIDKPIAPHFTVKGKMMVYRKGKNSITHFSVIEAFGLYSLVEFRIETGRTHQIRVHMAHLGHPIVGDAVYGRRRPQVVGEMSIERPMLHAWRIAFMHPRTGETVQVEAPLPEDIERVLGYLRSGKRK